MVLKNLQGSNGETDIENRLMDMGRGEERVRCMERVTCKLTFRSDQIRSVAQSCPTLCDPMNGSTQASLSLTNLGVHSDSRPLSQ